MVCSGYIREMSDESQLNQFCYGSCFYITPKIATGLIFNVKNINEPLSHMFKHKFI